MKAEATTGCAKHGNVKTEVAARKAEVATAKIIQFHFKNDTFREGGEADVKLGEESAIHTERQFSICKLGTL